MKRNLGPKERKGRNLGKRKKETKENKRNQKFKLVTATDPGRTPLSENHKLDFVSKPYSSGHKKVLPRTSRVEFTDDFAIFQKTECQVIGLCR